MQHKPQVERLANNKLNHNGLRDRMFIMHTLFLFMLFFIYACLILFLLGLPASVVLSPRLQGPYSEHRALRPSPPNAPLHIFEELARHNDCRLCKTWVYSKESQKHCPDKALDVAASHHLKAQK